MPPYFALAKVAETLFLQIPESWGFWNLAHFGSAKIACSILAPYPYTLWAAVGALFIILAQFAFRKPLKPSTIMAKALQKAGPNAITHYSEFINGWMIRKVPLRTAALSVLLVALVDALYLLAYPGSTVNPAAASVISTVLLIPIVEEFFFRGLVLGLMLLAINLLASKFRIPRLIKMELIALAIIIQAAFFAFGHENVGLLQLFSGILFALLFLGHSKLGSRRNLLPPMIAHAAHNVGIVVMTCGAISA